MDTNFWLQMWQNNQIGFHRSKPNPQLVQHFKALSLPESSRIFLPLSGKTLDIGWLLSKGYRVAGVELSEIAVEQLFDELDAEPQVSKVGQFSLYSAENIDIFVGDIFNLTKEELGTVDAVYDRAALVALPEETRKRYSAHLAKITENAPQLLLVYEYDQSLMEGPPFSISKEEIYKHYRAHYNISLLAEKDLDKLKGKLAAQEWVWLLEEK